MKHLPCFVFTALVCLGSNAAAAQEFGSRGTMAFGLERTMGFYASSYTLSDDRYDHSTDRTSFGFLGSPTPTPSPYALPRASFDYFIIDHLSLGGSIAFASSSVDRYRYDTRDRRTDRRGDGQQSVFVLAPRVGGAFALGDVIALWPRGGFTFYSQSERAGRRINESNLALTLEFHLVITPLPHFGITVGPVLDLGLSGGRDRDSANDPDWSLRHHSFGLAVGLFGWL